VGELDTERAAAMRAVIGVSDAPLFLGFGGHGGFDGLHGRGDRDGFDGREPRGGYDDERDGLPGDDDASDQSAPAPAAPADIIL
jgi:hypothetical protein